MTAIQDQRPEYRYTAPNGVEVYSCKPEPEDDPLLRMMFWSYKSWAQKIFWTQVNRVRFHLTGYEVPVKQKH